MTQQPEERYPEPERDRVDGLVVVWMLLALPVLLGIGLLFCVWYLAAGFTDYVRRDDRSKEYSRPKLTHTRDWR